MKQKVLKATCLTLFIVLICITSYFSFKIFSNYKSLSNSTLKSIYIAESEADITKYVIYGTHLNIEGRLKLKENSNSSFNLVMIDRNTLKEKVVPITQNITNNALEFYTSKTINQGIYLDSIQNDFSYIYLKETDNISGLSLYHNLKNTTSYGDLEYYTITKNYTNRKIDLKWESATFCITSKVSKLPEKYYDIVIDQGHGGKSTGAIGNGFTESLITYEYGVKLKKRLESLGLKVLITRDDILETVGDYDESGRAVIPNLVKAKYCLSIHINSSPINSRASGVEIYCPSHADLTFGKALADNIIEIAGSHISPNNVGRYSGGVYVLTFDKETIDECKEEALEDGYEPYDISLDTPLFFMIREVGGISTKAYVDGRNKKVGTNLFYNSNQTAEGYLLELGYISNLEDITNVTENMDSYVNAITKSIKDHLGL